MNIQEAKKYCKSFIEENKDRKIILHEAIDTVLAELDKKDKEIKELKQDNSKQWEERCRLTFELEDLERKINSLYL